MGTRIRALAMTVLAAAAVAGCDDGGTFVDDVAPGTFEGRVSGTVDGRVDGRAASGSSVAGYHDVVVLTDFRTGAEITLYHATDEFRRGTVRIEDFETGTVIADVYFADSRRLFTSTSGTLELVEVDGRGIDGTARFRAVELDGFGDPIYGSEVVVDVAFRTDYDPQVTFNRVPAPSTEKRTR